MLLCVSISVHAMWYTYTSGYSTTHTLTGLKELNQYRCRLRAANEVGTGKWSEVITVATTSMVYLEFRALWLAMNVCM